MDWQLIVITAIGSAVAIVFAEPLRKGIENVVTVPLRRRTARSRTQVLTSLPEVRRLTAASGTSFSKRLRSTSLRHLDSLVNTRLLDATVRDADVRVTERQLPPALFVTSAASRAVTEFLAGHWRAMFLVGDAGIGKSQLLVYLFRSATERDNQQCLFLQARLLSNWKLDVPLIANLGETVGGWEPTSPPTIVVIDAVNEWINAERPTALLDYLVNCVEDDSFPSGLRIVVSCRTETWNEYKCEHGRRPVVHPRLTFPGDGDAFFVTGFVSESDRAALYQAYQVYYHLRPLNYEATSPELRQLIREPFLMRLIAETYQNEAGAPAREIPKRLAYYDVFNLLTKRKINEIAGQLGTPAQSIVDVMASLGSILFKQITSERFHAPDWIFEQDAVAAAHVLRADAILRALVEAGLLEYDTIENKSGVVPVMAGAVRFFHDAYAQYCLAGIVRREVWASVESHPNNTPLLVSALDRLLATSSRPALISGAVEHWLFSSGPIADQFATLNALVHTVSGACRWLVASYVIGLRERGVLNTREWIDAMWNLGSAGLRVIVADALPHRLAELTPGDFASFLESCDDSDAAVVRVAVDILADAFLRTPDPRPLLAVIGRETGDFDTPTRLIQPASQKRLRFLLKFVVKSALMACGEAEKLRIIREFVNEHIPVIVTALFKDNLSPLHRPIRKRVYEVLEESGIDQWNEAIGPQDRNDEFFVEADGVVQRDLVYEFFSYVVAFHNGAADRTWLDPEHDFYKLCMRMLDLRPACVVGYVATVQLIAMLQNPSDDWRTFLQGLLAKRSKAAAHFGTLLTIGVAQAVPAHAQEAVGVVEREIMPQLLLFGIENEADVLLVSLFFSIIALDVNGLWPVCERTLLKIDSAARAGGLPWDRVAQVLSFSCFYPNVVLGERVTEFAFERYRGSASVVLETVLASLVARSPAVAEAVVARQDHVDPDLLDRARRLVTAELLSRRDQISYQAGWNGVILRGMTELPRVRYYLVRDLLGGLIQSNSVPEFAKEFRRFVVNSARDFLLQDGPHELIIDIESALGATESKRGPVGERWISRPTEETVEAEAR